MKLPKRVLVLAPHTDDAELGAGGTIARLTSEGSRVHVVAFSTCEEALPPGMEPDTLKRELMDALPMLGVDPNDIVVMDFPLRMLTSHRQEVLDELIRLRSAIDPDAVFLPCGHDLHQDHGVVHVEGLRAFKHATILGYELPWNNMTFDAQAFFELSADNVDAKVRALQQYRSQIVKKRPYFESDFLRSWARFRGLQVGTTYAEVFEVVRVRW